MDNFLSFRGEFDKGFRSLLLRSRREFSTLAFACPTSFFGSALFDLFNKTPSSQFLLAPDLAAGELIAAPTVENPTIAPKVRSFSYEANLSNDFL
ncbi:MAG: hypothetical protein WCL19_01875 [Verrucomicrobiota bacterium]